MITSEASFLPWLARPPRRSARVRLFCFPHSGGGASIFRDWHRDLPGWVDAVPVLLPGREERADEPPLASLQELVGAVAEALAPHLNAPFALFGHSLGGLLAFELTRRLQCDAGPVPAALLVAGLSPPHRLEPAPTHELPDDELLDAIFELGGTPALLREDKDVLRSALPALRTDVTLFCTYRHRAAPPVDCPVVVFGGRDDPIAAPEGMSAWGELTSQVPSVRMLSGGHFFVTTHCRELTQMVTAELRRNLRPHDRASAVPAAGSQVAVQEPKRRSRAIMEPVAVVGIGCRFPGANGPEQFWRMLVDGGDMVTEVPRSRTGHPPVFGKLPSGLSGDTPVRHGGFLDDVEGFDAAFFGIPPREAERMDPQQRLLLEVTWEALEDAQIPPSSLAGTRTGVFVGQMGRDYWELQTRQAAIDLHSLAGSGMPSFLSGRISFALDLRGPSMSLDTACSSSMTAVHLARQSLQCGDSDLAVAGGVNLVLLPELAAVYEQVGLMSRQGRCRFGDASADGFVRSEGVGVVVLKPLGRAQADGNRIYAVIVGSASNNDGSSSGSLVAPAQDAQEQLLRAAMDSAGVRPCEVDYVEAHGTGTTVGDRVELRALSRVVGEQRPDNRPCLVGSVKANIGHTEGAAGISGFIKTALSLHHRLIPANPLLAGLNPVLAEAHTRLHVPTEPVPWPEGPQPVAGVTSFGLSGTNVHVVLTADLAPCQANPPHDGDGTKPLLLPVSARDSNALHALMSAYADRLDGADPLSAAHVCAAAARGRAHHRWRFAVTATGGDDLAAVLRAQPIERGVLPATVGPRVAFVFPGHGSQWAGMGRELLTTSPTFCATIEECDVAIASEAGWSLLEVLTSDDPGPLERTAVIQPAVWAMEVALADHWRSWGAHPDVVIGHSFGEVAAAQVAGSIDLAEAARLICRRGALTQQADGCGGMVAVAMSAEAAADVAAEYDGRITVAAYNSPRSTVLAGDVDALAELLTRLRCEKIRAGRVRINFASHSHLMDPLRPKLLAALEGLRPRPVQIPFRSTVTGKLMSGADLGVEYWGDNLRCPVRFADAIAAESAEGPTVFLEVSPHPVLTPVIEQCLVGGGIDYGTTVASLHRDQPGLTGLANAAVRLYVAGVDLDWPAYYPDPAIVDDLPTYPWRHRHTWFTPDKSRSPVDAPAPEVVLPKIRIDVSPDGKGWNCVVSGTGVGASIEIGSPAVAGVTATPPADGTTPSTPAADRQVLPTQDVSLGDDLLNSLTEEVCTALGLPADRIPRGQPLRQVGCDSLTATEIRARIGQRWGVELPVGSVLGSTIDEIAAALATTPSSSHDV